MSFFVSGDVYMSYIGNYFNINFTKENVKQVSNNFKQTSNHNINSVTTMTGQYITKLNNGTITNGSIRGCFANMINLEIVNFTNLEYIGDYAFYGCRRLTTINIDFSKLQYIGTKSFFNCNLTKFCDQYLYLHNIRHIGANAFSGNTILSSTFGRKYYPNLQILQNSTPTFKIDGFVPLLQNGLNNVDDTKSINSTDIQTIVDTIKSTNTFSIPDSIKSNTKFTDLSSNLGEDLLVKYIIKHIVRKSSSFSLNSYFPLAIDVSLNKLIMNTDFVDDDVTFYIYLHSVNNIDSTNITDSSGIFIAHDSHYTSLTAQNHFQFTVDISGELNKHDTVTEFALTNDEISGNDTGSTFRSINDNSSDDLYYEQYLHFAVGKSLDPSGNESSGNSGIALLRHDFDYDISNNRAILTDYFMTNSYTNTGGLLDISNVQIPHTYKTYNVTDISGEVFMNNENITSLSGESIEYIDLSGASNCTNLEKIYFPHLKIINDSVFENCSKLTDVTIPNVEYIGKSAFKDCTSLTTLKTLHNLYFINSKAFKECSTDFFFSYDKYFPKLHTIKSDSFDDNVSFNAYTPRINVLSTFFENSIDYEDISGIHANITNDQDDIIYLINKINGYEKTITTSTTTADVTLELFILQNVLSVRSNIVNDIVVNLLQYDFSGNTLDISNNNTFYINNNQRANEITHYRVIPRHDISYNFSDITYNNAIFFNNYSIYKYEYSGTDISKNDISQNYMFSLNDESGNALYTIDRNEETNTSRITKTIDNTFQNISMNDEIVFDTLLIRENNGIAISKAVLFEITGNSVIQGFDLPNEVIIPDTFGGHDVTDISNNGLSGENITTISGKNITHIYDSAFFDCSGLTDVDFPNLRYIGHHAFSGCTSLQNITLENIVYIGEEAFKDCSGLLQKYYYLPHLIDISRNAFQNTSPFELKGLIPNILTTQSDYTENASDISRNECILRDDIQGIAIDISNNNYHRDSSMYKFDISDNITIGTSSIDIGGVINSMTDDISKNIIIRNIIKSVARETDILDKNFYIDNSYNEFIFDHEVIQNNTKFIVPLVDSTDLSYNNTDITDGSGIYVTHATKYIVNDTKTRIEEEDLSLNIVNANGNIMFYIINNDISGELTLNRDQFTIYNFDNSNMYLASGGSVGLIKLNDNNKIFLINRNLVDISNTTIINNFTSSYHIKNLIQEISKLLYYTINQGIDKKKYLKFIKEHVEIIRRLLFKYNIHLNDSENKVYINNVDFNNSTFKNILLEDIIFKNCNFKDCTIQDDSIIDNCTFIQCDFSGCDFSGTQLSDVIFSKCIFFGDSNSNWDFQTRITFIGINFPQNFKIKRGHYYLSNFFSSNINKLNIIDDGTTTTDIVIGPYNTYQNIVFTGKWAKDDEEDYLDIRNCDMSNCDFSGCISGPIKPILREFVDDQPISKHILNLPKLPITPNTYYYLQLSIEEYAWIIGPNLLYEKLYLTGYSFPWSHCIHRKEENTFNIDLENEYVMHDVSFNNSTFPKTEINEMDFSGCDFRNCIFRDSKFKNNFFLNCNFQKSSFKICDIRLCKFFDTNFSNQFFDLNSMDFVTCDFSGVDLSGVKLTNITFRECMFYNTKTGPLNTNSSNIIIELTDYLISTDTTANDDVTNMYILGPYVNISHDNLSNNNLNNVIMYGMDVSNTNLYNVQFENTSTGPLKKTGDPILNTDIYNISKDGEWWIIGPNINIDDADLSNNILTDCKTGPLYGFPKSVPANFIVCTNENLSYIIGTGVDLSGSNLSNFNLEGANIANINLTNAILLNTRTGPLVHYTDTIVESIMLSSVYKYIFYDEVAWIIGPSLDYSFADFGGFQLPLNLDMRDCIFDYAITGPLNRSSVRPILSSNYKFVIGDVQTWILGPNIDLTNADLSGMDLSGIDLRGVLWYNTYATGVIGTPKLSEGYGYITIDSLTDDPLNFIYGPGIIPKERSIIPPKIDGDDFLYNKSTYNAIGFDNDADEHNYIAYFDLMLPVQNKFTQLLYYFIITSVDGLLIYSPLQNQFKLVIIVNLPIYIENILEIDTIVSNYKNSRFPIIENLTENKISYFKLLSNQYYPFIEFEVKQPEIYIPHRFNILYGSYKGAKSFKLFGKNNENGKWILLYTFIGTNFNVIEHTIDKNMYSNIVCQKFAFVPFNFQSNEVHIYKFNLILDYVENNYYSMYDSNYYLFPSSNLLGKNLLSYKAKKITIDDLRDMFYYSIVQDNQSIYYTINDYDFQINTSSNPDQLKIEYNEFKKKHILNTNEKLRNAVKILFSNNIFLINSYENISNWDVSGVTNMDELFKDTSFNYDISKWDIRNVTSMISMFENCYDLNIDFTQWKYKVRNVTFMNHMFRNCTSMTYDIYWDVPYLHSNNVNENTKFYFYNLQQNKYTVKTNQEMKFIMNMWKSNRQNAINIYGNIASLNTNKVTDLSDLMNPNKVETIYFNDDISSWDVSNITNMTNMFYNCRFFNQDLSKWDVSSVTDMSGMFYGCSSFNGNIADWDVSGVTNMNFMFYECSEFVINLGNWNLNQLLSSNTNRMFLHCTAMENLYDSSTYSIIRHIQDASTRDRIKNELFLTPKIESWKIYFDNVTTKFNDNGKLNNSYILDYDICGNIKYDFELWDVSNVEDMSELFKNINDFYVFDIGNWDVSNVTNMSQMFYNNLNFNSDLSAWDNKVSKVENMSEMFYGCKEFSGNSISKWNVSSVTDMSGMFYKCAKFNADLSEWDVSEVNNTNNMFYNCSEFQGYGLDKWYNKIEQITNFAKMFYSCNKLDTDVSGWKLKYLDEGPNINMDEVFFGCSAFRGNGLNTWKNLDNIQSMNLMFYDTSMNNLSRHLLQDKLDGWFTKLNADVSCNNVINYKTRNVSEYDYKENNPSTLTNFKYYCHFYEDDTRNILINDMSDNISNGGNFEDTHWTIHLTDCSGLFNHSWLQDISFDISNWEFTNTITNMSEMFKECSKFNQDISGLNVTNVTNFLSMFEGCHEFNQDLTNWKVGRDSRNNGSQLNLNKMFYDCCANLLPKNTENDMSKNILCTWYVDSNTSMSEFTNTHDYYSDISHNNWYTKFGLNNESITVLKNAGIFDNLEKWDVSEVTNMEGLFQNQTFEQTNEYNGKQVVDNNIANFNDIKYKNMNFIDLSGWNVSNVTDMSGTFLNFGNNIVFENWDITNVTTMENMFRVPKRDDPTKNTRSIKIHFKTDSTMINLKSARSMFENNQQLQHTNDTEIVNISKNGVDFSGSPWTTIPGDCDVSGMFSGCDLFADDLSAWNVNVIQPTMVNNFSKMKGMIIQQLHDSTYKFLKIDNSNIYEEFTKYYLYKIFTDNNISSQDFPYQSEINSGIDISGATDISGWNMSMVTDISGLFASFATNNSHISYKTDIGNCVSKINENKGSDICNNYFDFSAVDLSDIQYWFDVSLNKAYNNHQVKNVSSLFKNNKSLHQQMDYLSNWRLNHVDTTESMFEECTQFNSDISGLTINSSSLTTTKNMFKNCTNFNSNFNFNSAKVKNMKGMFEGCINLNNPSNISNWTVNEVTNMELMFKNCSKFNKNLQKWNVKDTAVITNMFQDICNNFWTDISQNYLFLWNHTNLTSAYKTQFPSNFTIHNDTLSYLIQVDIYKNINYWDVSNVTDMSHLFSQKNKFDTDISGWDVINVTTMESMFENCSSFDKDISSWNVSNITNMRNMFKGCSAFNKYLGEWYNRVENVETMEGMFENCSKFNRTTNGTNEDTFTNWNVINVRSMKNMFKNTAILNTSFCSTWNFEKIESMESMFQNCSQLFEVIFPDISNCENTSYMFQDCENLLSVDFSGENFNDLNFASGMFKNCKNLVNDLSYFQTFKFNNLVAIDSMFENCKSITTLISEDGTDIITDWNINAAVQSINHIFDGADQIVRFIEKKYNIFSVLVNNTLSLNFTLQNWLDIKLNHNNVYTFTTKEVLEEAIDLYYTNRNNAIFRYGAINTWNVENIDNFDNLFKNRTIEFSISNWLAPNLTSMESMFEGCTTFNQDISNLFKDNRIQNLKSVFKNCREFDNVTGIKTLNATTTESMFEGCESLEEETIIENFNVTNVTNMKNMFKNCINFNTNLSSWDVKNVTSMESMFDGCKKLNEPIFQLQDDDDEDDDNEDDLVVLENTKKMFRYCIKFNNNSIKKWNTENITDMGYMFDKCTSFNIDISSWKTYNLRNTEHMFNSCINFNQDLHMWNVSKITNMNYMFYNCKSFNKSLFNWNAQLINSVKTTNMFFKSKIAYEKNIPDTINISAWKSYFQTFTFETSNQLKIAVGYWYDNKDYAEDLYGNIQFWNVEEITDMSNLFRDKYFFNDDLSLWNVSNVTNMRNMFQNAYMFQNKHLYKWNVNKVSDMTNIFKNTTLESSKNFSFAVNKTNWYKYNYSYKFEDDTELDLATNLWMSNKDEAHLQYNDIRYWNIDNITNLKNQFVVTDGSNNIIDNTFNEDISRWNVENVSNMAHMFSHCSNFNQDLSNWNVSNVKNMQFMFDGCHKLNTDLSGWNISNCTNTSYMFRNCYDLSSNFTIWNTANVVYMKYMFQNNLNLYQNFDKWNINNVLSMENIFDGCDLMRESPYYVVNSINPETWFFHFSTYNFVDKAELETAIESWFDDQSNAMNTYGNISQWNTHNVTDMSELFFARKSFDFSMTNWDVSNVTNMYKMFEGCVSFNSDITSWDVSKVTNMSRMFYNCSNFNQDISNWNVTLVTDFSEMFAFATDFRQSLKKWNISTSSRHISIEKIDDGAFGGSTATPYRPPPPTITPSPTPSPPPTITESITTPNLLRSNNWSVPSYCLQQAGGRYIWNNYNSPIPLKNEFYLLSSTKMFLSFKYLLPYMKTQSLDEVTKCIVRIQVIKWATNDKIYDQTINLSSKHESELITGLYNTHLIHNIGSENFYNYRDVLNIPTQDKIVKVVFTIHGNKVIDYGDDDSRKAGTMVEDVMLQRMKDELNESRNPTTVNCLNMFKSTKSMQNYFMDIDDTPDISDWNELFYTYNFNVSDSNGSSIELESAKTNILDINTRLESISIYGNIQHWDVSNIRNFSYLFEDLNEFNEDISSWDVSLATNMNYMFSNCEKFNVNISDWNVSNCLQFQNMFQNCNSFDINLQNWDVSSNAIITNIFEGCSKLIQKYNLNINALSPDTWAQSFVFFQTKNELKNAISNYTFSDISNNTAVTNHSTVINTYGEISYWNVSKITDMSFLFSNIEDFNEDISGWDVSNVTNMNFMFYGCTEYTNFMKIKNWDIGNVISMNNIFKGTPFRYNYDPFSFFSTKVQLKTTGAFRHYIKLWSRDPETAMRKYGAIEYVDTSFITDMRSLFRVTPVTKEMEYFNEDIQLWNVSNVTNMANMFRGCKLFNSELNLWDVSNVTDMKNMFRDCETFSRDISEWNVTSVENFSYMFKKTKQFNVGIGETWKFGEYAENIIGMFEEATIFDRNISFNIENTKIKSLKKFLKDCQNFDSEVIMDTINITDFSYMFHGCTSLNYMTDRNTFYLNLLSAKTTELMFAECTSMEQILIYEPTIMDLKNTRGMFVNCNKCKTFQVHLNMQNVTDCSYMFCNCDFYNATEVHSLYDLNNSESVNMESMFQNCYSMTYDGIGIWKTGHVTNMKRMFSNCKSFDESKLDNWDIGLVTNVNYMFEGCESFSHFFPNWANQIDDDSTLRFDKIFGHRTTDNNILLHHYTNYRNHKFVSMDTDKYSKKWEQWLLLWCNFKEPDGKRNLQRLVGVIQEKKEDSNERIDFIFKELASDRENLIQDCSNLFAGIETLKDQDFTEFPWEYVTNMKNMFKNSYNFKGNGIDSWFYGKYWKLACDNTKTTAIKLNDHDDTQLVENETDCLTVPEDYMNSEYIDFMNEKVPEDGNPISHIYFVPELWKRFHFETYNEKIAFNYLKFPYYIVLDGRSDKDHEINIESIDGTNILPEDSYFNLREFSTFNNIITQTGNYILVAEMFSKMIRVKNVEGMFENCHKLQHIDFRWLSMISNNLTNYNNLFKGCFEFFNYGDSDIDTNTYYFRARNFGQYYERDTNMETGYDSDKRQNITGYLDKRQNITESIAYNIPYLYDTIAEFDNEYQSYYEKILIQTEYDKRNYMVDYHKGITSMSHMFDGCIYLVDCELQYITYTHTNPIHNPTNASEKYVNLPEITGIFKYTPFIFWRSGRKTGIKRNHNNSKMNTDTYNFGEFQVTTNLLDDEGGTSGKKELKYNIGVCPIFVSYIEDMSYMFKDCIRFNPEYTITTNNLDLYNTRIILSDDPGNATNRVLYTFYKPDYLTSRDTTGNGFFQEWNWEIPYLTNTSYMFENCVRMNKFGFRGGAMNRVEFLQHMYSNCWSLPMHYTGVAQSEQGLYSVEHQSPLCYRNKLENARFKAKNMDYMFSGCVLTSMMVDFEAPYLKSAIGMFQYTNMNGWISADDPAIFWIEIGFDIAELLVSVIFTVFSSGLAGPWVAAKMAYLSGKYAYYTTKITQKIWQSIKVIDRIKDGAERARYIEKAARKAEALSNIRYAKHLKGTKYGRTALQRLDDSTDVKKLLDDTDDLAKILKNRIDDLDADILKKNNRLIDNSLKETDLTEHKKKIEATKESLEAQITTLKKSDNAVDKDQVARLQKQVDEIDADLTKTNDRIKNIDKKEQFLKAEDYNITESQNAAREALDKLDLAKEELNGIKVIRKVRTAALDTKRKGGLKKINNIKNNLDELENNPFNEKNSPEMFKALEKTRRPNAGSLLSNSELAMHIYKKPIAARLNISKNDVDHIADVLHKSAKNNADDYDTFIKIIDKSNLDLSKPSSWKELGAFKNSDDLFKNSDDLSDAVRSIREAKGRLILKKGNANRAYAKAQSAQSKLDTLYGNIKISDPLNTNFYQTKVNSATKKYDDAIKALNKNRDDTLDKLKKDVDVELKKQNMPKEEIEKVNERLDNIKNHDPQDFEHEIAKVLNDYDYYDYYVKDLDIDSYNQLHRKTKQLEGEKKMYEGILNDIGIGTKTEVVLGTGLSGVAFNNAIDEAVERNHTSSAATSDKDYYVGISNYGTYFGGMVAVGLDMESIMKNNKATIYTDDNEATENDEDYYTKDLAILSEVLPAIGGTKEEMQDLFCYFSFWNDKKFYARGGTSSASINPDYRYYKYRTDSHKGKHLRHEITALRSDGKQYYGVGGIMHKSGYIADYLFKMSAVNCTSVKSMFEGSAIQNLNYHYNQGFDGYNFHFELSNCRDFSMMLQHTKSLDRFYSDDIYAVTPTKDKVTSVEKMFFNSNPSFAMNFINWELDMDVKMNYFYGNPSDDYESFSVHKTFENMRLLDTEDDVPDKDEDDNKITWKHIFKGPDCVIC